MGTCTEKHHSFWKHRVKQEEKYLRDDMLMMYGKDCENLVLQAHVQAPLFGETTPWPQPHLRTSNSTPSMPRLTKADVTFRAKATMSNWDASLGSTYGLAKETLVHRTMGGTLALPAVSPARLKTGASAPSGRDRGWLEDDPAWDAPPSSHPRSLAVEGRLPTSSSQRSRGRTSSGASSRRSGALSAAASSVMIRREVEQAVRQAMSETAR